MWKTVFYVDTPSEFTLATTAKNNKTMDKSGRFTSRGQSHSLNGQHDSSTTPPWRQRLASLPTSGNIKNAGMAYTRGGRLVNLPWLMAMRRRREEARKMGNETAGTMRCYAITWERCIILFWMQEQTRTTKQQPTNSKKETWDQIPFIKTISFIEIVSIYKSITKKSCCIRTKSCFIQ